MARLTLNFVNKNEGDLVKVTVEGGFYNTTATRTTTNDALTLIVLDGDYTLTVEGDGYEDYIQSVSVAGDTTIEVALVPLGAGKYPYVPADNLYLGNTQVQKVYLGSRLVWELQSQSQSEPIIISSATVGIHPNYIWIESSELADVKDTLEGNIQKVVLNDQVTINQSFEYDQWSSRTIQLEGHPDNPTIYEEVRNALGPRDAFSDVQVAIYTE